MSKVVGYTTLTDSQVELMNEVKAKGNELCEVLDKLSSTPELDKRAIAIARTEIQTGVMWAVRSIAKPLTAC